MNSSTALFLLLSADAFAQSSVSWPKEPDSFRGAKFGSSQSEVRARFTFDGCVPFAVSLSPEQNYDEKLCYFTFDLAEKLVAGVLTFQRDSFVEVSGVFTREAFPVLLDVFTQRYDKPMFQDGDQRKWVGTTVSMQFDGVVSIERQAKVDDIQSCYCALRRKVVEKLYAFEYEQIKQRHEELDRREPIVSKQAREVIALLHQTEQMEANKERNTLEAERDCREFAKRDYGLFSITNNSYAAQVAKRKADLKKKAAGIL